MVSFNKQAAQTLVNYTVDDVYIFTFADASYAYLVYTSETEYKRLKDAYEQNLITRDDLVAIAQAEKQYDTLAYETTLD